MNKTILITGASRGIGQACAIQLASPNTNLVLLARTSEDLENTAKLCEKKGAKVFKIALELSNISQIQKTFQHIYTLVPHIDILINNAGIWIEESFETGDMNLWDQALDVNLKSVIHVTRYVLEKMPENGAIIFIGSTASKRTYANGTNYCAAKYGLLGFSGALFEDIREKGIKVSSIFPGVVNTDMHKYDEKLVKEKMIQPEDIAQSVQFILNTPNNICPTEIVIQPQKNPKNK